MDMILLWKCSSECHGLDYFEPLHGTVVITPSLWLLVYFFTHTIAKYINFLLVPFNKLCFSWKFKPWIC